MGRNKQIVKSLVFAIISISAMLVVMGFIRSLKQDAALSRARKSAISLTCRIFNYKNEFGIFPKSIEEISSRAKNDYRGWSIVNNDPSMQIIYDDPEMKMEYCVFLTGNDTVGDFFISKEGLVEVK